MKATIRGKKLTVDMNEEEENIFFREGLQSFADKWFPNKVKVLSEEQFSQYGKQKKTKKKIEEIEFDDGFSEECVKEGILSALRKYIEKLKKEDTISKKKK